MAMGRRLDHDLPPAYLKPSQSQMPPEGLVPPCAGHGAAPDPRPPPPSGPRTDLRSPGTPGPAAPPPRGGGACTERPPRGGAKWDCGREGVRGKRGCGSAVGRASPTPGTGASCSGRELGRDCFQAWRAPGALAHYCYLFQPSDPTLPSLRLQRHSPVVWHVVTWFRSCKVRDTKADLQDQQKCCLQKAVGQVAAKEGLSASRTAPQPPASGLLLARCSAGSGSRHSSALHPCTSLTSPARSQGYISGSRADKLRTTHQGRWEEPGREPLPYSQEE
ncbi:uncharacterized protein LOC109490470 [Ailuropoda melanoleuca]|uniref:uncharacterized protein LOC109490470 n=1 Tax=Ailuropoda melanoleuca TaxID=9646 RepID=UPI001494F007|nr:uncharacterized protein LOC109490470 [Ailuropoda melanoleuca]